jgi:hypothetical protein
MKKSLHIKMLLAVLVLCCVCLSNFASAAPNIAGLWKGSANKVTTASCSVPTPVNLTLIQCKVGRLPGNLFNGTLKVGTTSVKIIGRIDPDSTFQARGTDFSLTTGKSINVTLMGKYIAATSKIQITEATSITTSATGISDELYDIITLSR